MKSLYSLLILFLVFTATVKAQVSEQEFQALKALYNATNGDNWTNRTGWENINTTATKDDVSTAWKGIINIADGHLIQLGLTNNNLVGEIPQEVGDMTWLTGITLGNNKLSGTIPPEFGNLVNLISFDLSSNQFTGELPITMKNLTKLKWVSFEANSFNGSFPSEIIAEWLDLEILNAYRCNFVGSVQDIFENLTHLRIFDISQNQLTGEFPFSIGNIVSLTNFSIFSNHFSGNLPALANCTNLQIINVSDNDFSGIIPQSWANLSSIKSIELQKNLLTGLIPIGIFKPSLNNFSANRNYFTFEGIEPVYNNLNSLPSKSYWTDKFFTLNQKTLSVNAGEALNLNAANLSVYNLGGNNNRYKWFRNDEEVYSGNSPIYSAPFAGSLDAGVYRFEVTNTVVTRQTFISENITVTIVSTNQSPTDITLSPSFIDENFIGLVGTLSATDPDEGDIHTFSKATGNGINDRNNNMFSIAGNQLSISSSANFEAFPSLNLLITANDGNGGVFTKALNITVNNVNEAPIFNGQVTSNNIDETSDNGSTVFNLTASDPEGTSITYTITSGNENGVFGISDNKLVVADNTKFNYDLKNSYTVTVNASDGILSANTTLTVNLNKINQIPQVENAVFAIDENSQAGTIVGTIAATDREGDPLTYSITAGNAAGAFTLDGNTLKVANSAPLDYETTTQFVLTVNVSDGVSNVQATITINLNNVSENTDNSIVTFSVPGMEGEAIINETTHTIQASVRDVDLSALAATFSLSEGATSTPTSGTTLNFSTPQTITVTAQSGDVQEWVINVGLLVGTNDFVNSNLKIYPNPTRNLIHISGLTADTQLKVVSLVGQVLISKTSGNMNEPLEVSTLKNGIYFLLIENPSVKSIIKFIKE